MVEKRAARRARWASVREGSSWRPPVPVSLELLLVLVLLLFSAEVLSVVLSEGLLSLAEVDSGSVVLEVSDSGVDGISVSDLVGSAFSLDEEVVDSDGASVWVWGGGGMRMTLGEDSVSLLSAALFSVASLEGGWVEKKIRPSRMERRRVPWRMPHIEGFIGLRDMGANWERGRPDDNAPPVPLQEEGRTASRIAVEEDIG